MSQEITVVDYCDQYKDEIIDLILNIQQKEFDIQISKDDQPDLSDIPSVYQNGSGNFWVALCNNRVIGTIALLDIANSQVALRKMFVQSSYRGTNFGTAKMLLLNAIEWARGNRITEIYLGTTDKFFAAHRFYEKNGFIRIFERDLPPGFPVMKVDTIFYRYAL